MAVITESSPEHPQKIKNERLGGKELKTITGSCSNGIDLVYQECSACMCIIHLQYWGLSEQTVAGKYW
jgi:hypothetical protein